MSGTDTLDCHVTSFLAGDTKLHFPPLPLPSSPKPSERQRGEDAWVLVVYDGTPLVTGGLITVTVTSEGESAKAIGVIQ